MSYFRSSTPRSRHQPAEHHQPEPQQAHRVPVAAAVPVYNRHRHPQQQSQQQRHRRSVPGRTASSVGGNARPAATLVRPGSGYKRSFAVPRGKHTRPSSAGPASAGRPATFDLLRSLAARAGSTMNRDGGASSVASRILLDGGSGGGGGTSTGGARAHGARPQTANAHSRGFDGGGAGTSSGSNSGGIGSPAPAAVAAAASAGRRMNMRTTVGSTGGGGGGGGGGNGSGGDDGGSGRGPGTLVYTWGLNDEGQCGVDRTGSLRLGILGEPRRVEGGIVDVDPAGGAAAVAAGPAHSLFVSSRGDVWGFGSLLVLPGAGGEGLGRSTGASGSHEQDSAAAGRPSGGSHDSGGGRRTVCGDDQPRIVLSSRDVLQCLGLRRQPRGGGAIRIVGVACGNRHSAAVTECGRLLCWGNNDCGQLGRAMGGGRGSPGTSPSAKHPDAVSQPPPSTSRGGCDRGRDRGATANTCNSPAQPEGSDLSAMGVVAVSCGSDFTVAVTASGACFSFGNGANGQLGTGSLECSVARPTRVRGHLLGCRVVQVACGSAHTLFVTSAGVAFSCGLTSRGRLGQGRAGSGGVASLGSGQTGSSRGSGDGGGGSGGGSSRDARQGVVLLGEAAHCVRPHPVNYSSTGKASSFIIHACAGGSSGAFVTKSGDLYTWGDNQYGQLGHGAGAAGPVDEWAPTKVEAFLRERVHIRQTSLGIRHLVAVSSLGNV